MLAGATLAVSLVACGATPDAAPAPAEPSAVPTPTPSAPASTAVVTPTSVATVQAEEPTFTPTGTFNENDALAFGMYYIQIVNYVRLTGDPSLLQRYAEPGCSTCDFILTATEDIRSNGARYLHPELTFGSAYLDYYSVDEQRAEVRVEVTGDLGQLVAADGELLHEPNPIENAEAFVQMIFKDGQWRLFEVL